MIERVLCVGVAALTLIEMAGLRTACAADKVKVGIVVGLSGAGAGTTGLPSRDSALTVIEGINSGTLPAPYASKGIAGMQIEPVLVDETGSTVQVVEEYRNLVQRQKVDVVIGYSVSGNCLAVAPVAESLKQLTLLFDCGTPRVFEEARYKYVFRTNGTSTMLAIGAAGYVAAQLPSITHFAGINQNYAWGRDSWNDFVLAMKKIKPNAAPGTAQFPKLFQGQFNAEITKLLSDQPDLIFSSFWGTDLESFIGQSTTRGLRSTMLFTVGEISMFRLAGQIPDGTIMGGRGACGVMAKDTELNRWFRKKFTERAGQPPTCVPYGMAQAVLALKSAYDKAAKANGGKKPTTDQVAAALEYLEFESMGGSRVKMAIGNGHQAIVDAVYGQFRSDPAKGPTITNARFFPADCVNPPDGATSKEWIEKGLPGQRCW
jgi:branched-chain amino acid transport system substrate-binding protein